MQPFAHLHVHSEYSLLDGSAKIKELTARAKEMGMDSLAITDHGVMYGVIDFYKAATAVGIKPILGCEVYVATGSRHVKERRDEGNYHHLVLLAENETGYRNLIKLVSIGFTEGFYYKPRVDIEILREHNEGLIALSACQSGVVSKILLQQGYDAGKARALLYNEIFGENNFFLELQDHGLNDQQQLNPQLIRMSQETNIPLVATNDVHYIEASDTKAHDILLCIQTQKTILDENRMSYDSDQFYLKSPEEMYALFPYAKEALENTQKIADRCNLHIEFNNYKLPKFDVPAGKTASQHLKEICQAGLTQRYGEDAEKNQERLDYELNIISTMGFDDYFLIVADFIKYARDNKIMVGPGRGSGAGSIVAYALKITDVDPIPYNLLFERFLNPERVSMPDFDIDFCYERRQEVIDYVIRKYSVDHVAQIITFGTMKARAATRDVGRALAMPYADVDRVAKMIPTDLGMTLEKALKMSPDLKAAYDEEDDTRNLLDMSMRLEGLPRHSSTHAAGVVICDKPVSEYIPLNTNDGVITTQFPMGTVEELGLLKMDFLGLRTLTVIRIAAEEVERNKGIEIDLDHWKYDDPKVYEMISQAKTSGVFQLESSGMTSFMKDLQPESLEDLTAGISLYRPGPMDFIPKYVKGKRNPKKVTYMHEKLKPILEATYGCIVYQEQVMQIVRDLAGYSLGRSDLIRRAMSKKKADVMDEERKNFVYGLEQENVPGCIKNGIPEKAAMQIFDAMMDFAAYAFNKSHAACYAVIGYQTAWMKCYYPVEFMAAIMTSVMDSSDKVAGYIRECKKMGIPLLPPDVNEGYAAFSVSGDSIRFGLSSIKGVGRGAIDALVVEREANGKFTGISDFIRRVSGHDLNKRALESLIRSGAFDSLGGKRSQYAAVFSNIVDGLAQTKKSTVVGQLSLFDVAPEEEANDFQNDDLPNIAEFPKRQMLHDEKELLSVYVSGHPLADYENVLRGYTSTTSLDFVADESIDEDGEDGTKQAAMKDGDRITYGGMITAKSVKFTKADNKAFCFLTVEDMYGAIEVIVFSKMYEKIGSRLQVEQVLIIQGRVNAREDEATKIVAQEVLFYDDISESERELKGQEGRARKAEQVHEEKSVEKSAPVSAASTKKTFWIKVPKTSTTPLKNITDILTAHHGSTQVMIYNEAQNQKFLANPSFWVTLSDDLTYQMEGLLGRGATKVTEKAATA